MGKMNIYCRLLIDLKIKFSRNAWNEMTIERFIRQNVTSQATYSEGSNFDTDKRH